MEGLDVVIPQLEKIDNGYAAVTKDLRYPKDNLEEIRARANFIQEQLVTLNKYEKYDWDF